MIVHLVSAPHTSPLVIDWFSCIFYAPTQLYQWSIYRYHQPYLKSWLVATSTLIIVISVYVPPGCTQSSNSSADSICAPNVGCSCTNHSELRAADQPDSSIRVSLRWCRTCNTSLTPSKVSSRASFSSFGYTLSSYWVCWCIWSSHHGASSSPPRWWCSLSSTRSPSGWRHMRIPNHLVSTGTGIATSTNSTTSRWPRWRSHSLDLDWFGAWGGTYKHHNRCTWRSNMEIHWSIGSIKSSGCSTSWI